MILEETTPTVIVKSHKGEQFFNMNKSAESESPIQ